MCNEWWLLIFFPPIMADSWEKIRRIFSFICDGNVSRFGENSRSEQLYFRFSEDNLYFDGVNSVTEGRSVLLMVIWEILIATSWWVFAVLIGSFAAPSMRTISSYTTEVRTGVYRCEYTSNEVGKFHPRCQNFLERDSTDTKFYTAFCNLLFLSNFFPVFLICWFE